MTALLITSPVVVVGVAATVAAALIVWLGIVPRLPEPVTDEPKFTYRHLVTPRTAGIIAVFSAAAAWLAWSRLPTQLQPPWAVLSSVGIVLTAVDGYTTWIPARLTRWTWAAMLVAGAAMVPLGAHWTDLLRMILGAAAAGALYGLLWLASRGGFGFGDVRFVPIIAAPAAASSLAMLLTTFLVGSLFVLAHGLWRHVRRRPGLQPWAPGLTVASYLVMVIATSSP